MSALPPHIQSLIYSYDDTCLATLRRDVLPSIRAIANEYKSYRAMHLSATRANSVCLPVQLRERSVSLHTESSKTHRGSFHNDGAYKHPIKHKDYRRWKKRLVKYHSWSYCGTSGEWRFTKHCDSSSRHHYVSPAEVDRREFRRRSHFFIDTIDREMKREDRADRESGRFFYYG